MLPTFVSAERPSRRQKDVAAKARMTPKKTSYGKENRPIKGNGSKATKIPGPVKNLSKGLSENKCKASKSQTTIQQAPQKKTSTQNGRSTVSGNDYRKVLTNCEKEDFQIDAAAFQSIIAGASPIVAGKPERNTISVPNSRKIVLGEKTTTRASFHAGGLFPGLQKIRDMKVAATPEHPFFTSKKSTLSTNKQRLASANKNNSSASKIVFQISDSTGLESQYTDHGIQSKKPRATGPIRRIVFNGMQRSKPYNVYQERRSVQRKNDALKKLTFEQRLSVIINARPGLDGDRKTRYKQEIEKAQHCIKAVNTPISDSTCKILNQSPTDPVPMPSDCHPETDNGVPAGRPKPKLPGLLCEFNYISPRKKQQWSASQRFSGRKSPSRTLTELSATKEMKNRTPLRDWVARIAPKKPLPFKNSSAVKGNDENCADGKTQRKLNTPLTLQNDTLISKSAQRLGTDRLHEISSSVKNKKSVRWADVLERGKSEAHKQLNFDAENCSAVSNKEQDTKISGESSRLKSFEVKNIFESRLTTPGDIASTVAPSTRRTIESRFHKHAVDDAKLKTIPKPFISAPSTRTTIETEDWSTTPDEAKDQADVTSVPLVSPMDSLLAWLNPEKMDSTPLVDLSTLKLVPNCPAARRTWARTPHAKEEERKRQKAELENTLGQTFDSSTVIASSSVTETVPTSSTSSMSNVETVDIGKSDFQLITERILGGHKCEGLHLNPAELKARFDLSNGILKVMDDINRWSIEEDMRRVSAYTHNLTGLPVSSIRNTSSDCSNPSARNGETRSSSSSLASTVTDSVNERRAPCLHSVTSDTKTPVCYVKALLYSSDSLVNYLSSLPNPVTANENVIGKGPENATSVVYSTAAVRMNRNEQRVKASSVSASNPSTVASQAIDKLYAGHRLVSSIDSRTSSQSDASSGYVSLEDTNRTLSSGRGSVCPANEIIDNALKKSSLEALNRGPVAPSNEKCNGTYSINGSAFKPFSSKLRNGHRHATRSCSIELLDAEVAFYTKYLELATRLRSRKIETRDCHNPIAKKMTNCDCYHFTPIDE